ncbi:MAG: restriction endonuclease [Clostridia bacterium]
MNKKIKQFFIRFAFILIFIIFLPVIIIEQVVVLLVKYVRKLKWEKNGEHGRKLLLSYDLSKIDIIDGYKFEEYLKAVFFYEGYEVKLLQKSHDYGADLIISKDNKNIVVQAKRYKGNVGTKSVQEIVSAKYHYKADDAMVVTNSYFTDSAENLAKSNGVRLIDRDELVSIVNHIKTETFGESKIQEWNATENVSFDEKYPFQI